MEKPYPSQVTQLQIFPKAGTICLLILITTCAAFTPLGEPVAAYTTIPAGAVPTVGTQPGPEPTPGAAASPAGRTPGTSAAGADTVTLHYAIDRSAVPWLTYQNLTLKIYVGSAQTISAMADGRALPFAYSAGYVVVTTSSSAVDVVVGGGTDTAQVGSFSKTALKDDRQWAWSHSFDDNEMFKSKGIPAFEKCGWRGTVYLIGNIIDDTRNQDWIIDRPDIIALVKKGWGIGNHTWSHAYVKDLGGAAAARQDIIRLANYLRSAVNDAGRPDYRLMSFAAPMFDGDYQPIIQSLRDSQTTELLFNESGDRAFLRVDPGVSDDTYPVFQPDAEIGRDWRIDAFGTNSADDQAFRDDLNKIIAQVETGQHFWVNTFNHWVDDKPANESIFAFLPWLYNTYGPGGTNTVWVAPSEEIYSYLLVRDRAKVTLTKTNGGSIRPAATLPYSSFLPITLSMYESTGPINCG